MTETSGDESMWPVPGTGTPEQGALNVAVSIHRALTSGAESAWLYWQLSDNSVNTFSLTDRAQGASAPKYVAAKHFFRPIRPDSKRIEATSSAASLLVSAYYHEREGNLVVVLINTAQTDQLAPLTVQGLTGRLVSLQTFTSGPSARWQEGRVNADQLSVNVPAFGVVTVQGRVAASIATLARGRLIATGAK